MHWKNSCFQIQYFLAGKCHTPDEAYRVLCEAYEDRDIAIKLAEASKLRQKAKKLNISQVLLRTVSESRKLEAQAELIEMQALEAQGNAVIATAIQERDFIKQLIDKIQPFRKYKDIADTEAHQLAQQDEWKEELLWRAENFLVSQGTIPSDHIATMRMHPEWEQHLFPRISQMAQKLIELKKNNEALVLEGHKAVVLQ
jgi:hypothetical protein